MKIVYHGGSQPGTMRYVLPTKVENGKLFATCIESHQPKSFYIDKIEIVDGDIEPERWNRNFVAFSIYTTTQDIYNKIRGGVEEAGFALVYDSESISLRKRKKKDGQPLKSCLVDLFFEETVTNSIYDPDIQDFIHFTKTRKQPWILRAKDRNTKQYTTLDHAGVEFVHLVNSIINGGGVK